MVFGRNPSEGGGAVGLWDGRRVCVQRGFCGVALRLQCFIIAFTHVAVAFIVIIRSSMMLHSPLEYIDMNSISVDTSKYNTISANDTQDGIAETESPSSMDEIEKLTNQLLHEVGQNGGQLLVGGLATFIVSLLLIQGLRKEKTSMMFPFVIVSIMEILAAFISFMLKVTSPSSISVLKVFGALLYFTLSIYFTLSVYSYYQIITIKKRKVITFLDHEFQNGDGPYYRTLAEEGDPVPPYTEKAVPMTEEEDRGREHVLFAKV